MPTKPDKHDAAVVEKAFEAFWPKIWQDLKNVDDVTEDSQQEWKDSAWKVLGRTYHEDGYELAKEFEDENWEVDSEFVEMIDGWGHELYTAHKKAVAEWVEANKITPKLAAGTKVKVNVHHIRTGKDIHDGEIIQIDTGRGQYHVFVESLNHIRPNSGKSGCTGIMVDYPDLEALNQ
jgi:hypothetical protein